MLVTQNVSREGPLVHGGGPHPIALGALPIERVMFIEHQVLLQAAETARKEASIGYLGGLPFHPFGPPHPMDWKTLLSVCQWLTDYAEAMSTNTQPRRY